ncbi:hypothetical protein [Asaia krungthepensis]|uniref:Phosphohydrolase n=1 Tax=Asaia krungthepensis NRIC 0535 TaxID=1307925 RepID=A0ABQ0PXK9_9PROT|nr:hypothetical protein [Asaia krungthepensis]GBQ84115.1 phosphohydrolase [Asaia krungthepensis NRIC 0535]
MTDTQTSWHVTPLSPALEIVCHDAPFLNDDTVEAGIDEVWHDALAVHPRLYNGRVFCLSELTPSRLSGFWCEYRWVLAQMRSPALASHLKLRSLAVTGLLICPDGVVLGRRNPNSLYLPGYWQGVPAGSVEARGEQEPVDLGAQLLAELDEEIGFSDDVSLTPPLLACEHTETHIVDIGFGIHTTRRFDLIESAWRKRANDEYDRLECHPLDALHTLETTVLPTTRAMMERLVP